MKKRLILLVTALVLVLAMVACGSDKKKKVTAESVLSDMQKTVEDLQSLKADVELKLGITIALGDNTIPVALDANLAMEILQKAEDDVLANMSGSVDLNIAAQKMAEEFNIYSATKGGDTTTYLYLASSNEWVKNVSTEENTDAETEIEAETDDTVKNEADMPKIEEFLTLKEGTEKYNDKDCYVLVGIINNDTLSKLPLDDAAAESGVSLSAIEEIGLNVAVKLYIDKKTNYPVAMIAEHSNKNAEKEEAFITIDEFKLVVNIDSINAIKEIVIPKEALNAKEAEDTIINIEGLDIFGSGMDMEEDFEQELPDEKDDVDAPETPDVNDNVVLPDDWTTYAFSINGKVLTLPCTYAEFSEVTGYTMTSATAKSYVESDVAWPIDLYSDDKKALEVMVYNYADKDLLFADCLVCAILQSDYDVMNTGDYITFPYNLKIGDIITKDELVTMFGEPYDINDYVSDGYISYEFTYYEDLEYSDYNYFKISVINDLIYNIYLSNLGYDQQDFPEGVVVPEYPEEEEVTEEVVFTSVREGTVDDLSADWKDYEVFFDGNIISLPCTYKELKALTGYAMKPAEEKSYLDSMYTTYFDLYLDDNEVLYIEVVNDTDGDQKNTDCLVTKIAQTSNHLEYAQDAFVFPGNLKVGTKISKDELTKLFGEPDDTYDYESDGYVQFRFTYSEYESNTTLNCMEINVVNGIIDEIVIDHVLFK